MALSRRSFLKLTGATSAALALGPSRWGWAQEGSPFGLLQDDPLLRLPEGYSYEIIAETGMALEGGRGPTTRPQFPDLNTVIPQPGGKILLSTSHEVPAEAPIGNPPPEEEYDPFAGGAITSLLLNPDLTIAESAYNAGGMANNCSGSRTPWKTVLTGEESTATLGADHGFIWEVDPFRHTKVRLDACGRFEHETAVVDPATGFVYLTEDSGDDSLLYRMKPKVPGRLKEGGILQAYRSPGGWVTIDDPLGTQIEPSAQGIERGASKFARLEGGRKRGRWFYFTETEDDTACGKIWRLQLDTYDLELWAEGSEQAQICMPDNLAFDGAQNMFVTEDKGTAGRDNPNRIWFIDRATGEIALFGELVVQTNTPGVNVADEPTGPVFSPDKKVLFLNLQRGADFGVTLAIKGPFAARRGSVAGQNVAPRVAWASEHRAVEEHGRHLGPASLGLSMGVAAGLIALRRRGSNAELPPDLAELARELGTPMPVPTPKRRVPRT